MHYSIASLQTFMYFQCHVFNADDCFRSLDCQDAVRFGSNLTMTPAQVRRLGWGDELVNATVDFIKRLRGIQFDLTEYCILNAIVLTYPGKCVRLRHLNCCIVFCAFLI
jgi:hypothetical protein